MWQLHIKDKTTDNDWRSLGTFADINPAARRVRELEGDPRSPMFFRVYADPLMEKSDADILSRLEYQGTNGLYVLTRRMQ